MLFGNCCKKIKIDIKSTIYVIKFLGMLINDKFNWKEHISMIQCKLKKNIAIIYRAKYLLKEITFYIILFTISPIYVVLL